MLGFNDLYSQTTFDVIQENIQEIINKVNNGKRKIYLVKFYTDEVGLAIGQQITGGSFPIELIQMYISGYNNLFSSLASSNKNVTMIEDIWKDIWDVPDHMSSSIYPSAKGYEIMADNIFAEMEPYLMSNGLVK